MTAHDAGSARSINPKDDEALQPHRGKRCPQHPAQLRPSSRHWTAHGGRGWFTLRRYIGLATPSTTNGWTGWGCSGVRVAIADFEYGEAMIWLVLIVWVVLIVGLWGGCAWVVVRDARRCGRSPLLWGVIGLVFSWVGLLAWSIRREVLIRRGDVQITAERRSSDGAMR